MEVIKMTIMEKMQEILKNEKARALANTLLENGCELVEVVERVYETIAE